MLTIISFRERCVSEKRKKGSNLHFGKGRMFGKGDKEQLELSEKYAQVEML